jgi:hypothetical protein
MISLSHKWIIALILSTLAACSAAQAAQLSPIQAPRQPGSTLVDITVGTDGLPKACAIEASSGNAEDDASACEFWMKTGRFEPSTGADGRATEHHQKFDMAPGALEHVRQWKREGAPSTSVGSPMPLTERPDEEGGATVDILVGTDGFPHGCAIATSSGNADDDARACRMFMARGHWDIQKDAKGQPIEYHLKIGMAAFALKQLREEGRY